MSRKRAYAGARIKTKDGRRGQVLSDYTEGSGRWFILFDAPPGNHEATDLQWVHRREFYLLGEEANPFAPAAPVVLRTTTEDE